MVLSKKIIEAMAKFKQLVLISQFKKGQIAESERAEDQ